MVFLPIVDRELRVAARRAGTYWQRFWAAAVVLVIWFFLVLTSSGMPAAQMGRLTLNSLGILALGFSLFAGAFLTADCLAEEKREGTLGLLFLTDLKAHDVVLGKLAAKSLNALYGLLAVFPVLGLSILMGGVTGAEFARVVLVFLSTIFCSLGIGMMFSATGEDARQSLVRALVFLVVMTGVFPALWWCQHLVMRVSAFDFLLLPSPVWAYMNAFESYYRFSQGPAQFWASVGILLAVGGFCLGRAILVLPRAWQEGPEVTALQKPADDLVRSPMAGLRTTLLENPNPFRSTR